MVDFTQRHLYLCVSLRNDMSTFLPAVLGAGVDVVQLREKNAPEDDQLRAGREMKKMCADFGVPFIMNDSPTLALAVDADGVHVGQDDISVAECRELLGSDAVVGISTHASDEFTASLPLPVTYRSAGPIVPTPTKPGREATGIDYAVWATQHSPDPVFVTGGVDSTNIASLIDAGLRHFVVVRSLTQSSNPAAEARAMRDIINSRL